jgi:hypothetical protein
MDFKQIGLGIVEILIFLGFQLGLLNPLGSVAWLVGVIVFSVILYLIGRASMPRRQPPLLEELWKFIVGFAVVLTAVYSLGAPLLASMMPASASMTMTQATAIALGSWLVIFGAAMLVTGWTTKWGVTTAVGVIWVFNAILFFSGAGSYFDFGLITGLPFVIYGIITKG